jgi:threonine/homoserine/homoserine lactone efflux protein
MRSALEFLLIAVVVTITPGPGTATIMRMAVRYGRRPAFSAVIGNSIGLFAWALLSALGVSALIIASEIAHTVLRIGGAAFLIVLGVRSLLLIGSSKTIDAPAAAGEETRASRTGWRVGLATSLSNPKLAVFFVALFPQFLTPGTALLPMSMLMALVVIALDVIWFGTIIYAVDRAATLLRPRVKRVMERTTGGALVVAGTLLVTEA